MLASARLSASPIWLSVNRDFFIFRTPSLRENPTSNSYQPMGGLPEARGTGRGPLCTFALNREIALERHARLTLVFDLVLHCVQKNNYEQF